MRFNGVSFLEPWITAMFVWVIFMFAGFLVDTEDIGFLFLVDRAVGLLVAVILGVLIYFWIEPQKMLSDLHDIVEGVPHFLLIVRVFLVHVAPLIIATMLHYFLKP